MTETIHVVQGEELFLLPEKVLYWKNKKALILSDLHLGKAGHFRKAGVPVSSKVHWDEMFVLDALIEEWKPEKVLFLGDLFHSEHNKEWNDFINWKEGYSEIDFVLVLGNHDIIADQHYKTANMIVHESLLDPPFYFTHDKEVMEGYYNISGHVHPSVVMRGAGKQGLKLPCFYFSTDFGLLPAFGNFTGNAKILPKKKDFIYVVAENEVLDVSI